jgi:uncharacterized NAD(P)/FAD-binding protein YdhS
VGTDDAVVILGSGLTAVDAVMSLLSKDHRGPITLISRRGLLPQAHLQGHPSPVDLKPWVTELIAGTEPPRTLQLLRGLRQLAEAETKQGTPWQCVIDGLRPHIATLWSKLPVEERRRFLSHLRPFWEVHRHRMPFPVAVRFKELLAGGKVRMIAGRVDSVVATGEELKCAVRTRYTGNTRELVTHWIVNATGPSPSNSAAANPAIGSLLIQGLINPDQLNLGVQTTPDGHAIGTDGQAIRDLLVVGTLRKPDLWESTAVPELRTQAARAAEQIMAEFVTNNTAEFHI